MFSTLSKREMVILVMQIYHLQMLSILSYPKFCCLERVKVCMTCNLLSAEGTEHAEMVEK